MSPTTPETRVSELFDLPGSDVTLRSSDNVLFRVHKINLEMHSEAFAGAAALPPVAADDMLADADAPTVSLPETGAVLELLLQYMYLRPQPVLDSLSIGFWSVAALAEAAEKYQVYAAMQPCKVQIRSHLSSLWVAGSKAPFEILLYAIKHHHHDLVDEAAALAITTPLSKIQAALPAQWFSAWIYYQEAWSEFRTYVYTAGERFHFTHEDRGEDYLPLRIGYECWRWTRIWAEVTDRLHRLKYPRDFEDVFRIEAKQLMTDEERRQAEDPEAPPPDILEEGCAKCDEQLTRWKTSIMKHKEFALKGLSAYLPSGTY
ncbi:hypothetical protein PLICRDRAFT_184566 [Plicaturopsis crispa FD-325 SS-3]|nr:hypothetical protein PLICRDRAFT_184566 [Plicaturopsis crispa FD-325 SS-3]